jgi:hypothetical protein
MDHRKCLFADTPRTPQNSLRRGPAPAAPCGATATDPHGPYPCRHRRWCPVHPTVRPCAASRDVTVHLTPSVRACVRDGPASHPTAATSPPVTDHAFRIKAARRPAGPVSKDRDADPIKARGLHMRPCVSGHLRRFGLLYALLNLWPVASSDVNAGSWL